jgi:hypothetical protein
MQVCPFIIGKIEHADVEKIAARYKDTEIKVVEEVLPARNPYWVIVKAHDWQLVKFRHSPSILIQPNKIKQTEPLHAETMSAADWRKVEKFLLAPQDATTNQGGQ